MNKEKTVLEFLRSLEQHDPERFEILDKLRHGVLEQFPTAEESLKYGGILFSLNEQFGGLFMNKNHISFEFSYGYLFKTSLPLEGTLTEIFEQIGQREF